MIKMTIIAHAIFRRSRSRTQHPEACHPAAERSQPQACGPKPHKHETIPVDQKAGYITAHLETVSPLFHDSKQRVRWHFPYTACRKGKSSSEPVTSIIPALPISRSCFQTKHLTSTASFQDMKSNASTPLAPVPDISPSCLGTQSPRHPHLWPRVLGSAEVDYCAPAHTCVRSRLALE